MLCGVQRTLACNFSINGDAWLTAIHASTKSTARYGHFKTKPVPLYLFVVYLTTLSVAQTIHRRMIRWLWMIHWKGYRRWPNLRCSPGICLKELRKTTINLGQYIRSPGRDFNPRLPQYDAAVLTSRLWRSEHLLWKQIFLVRGSVSFFTCFIVASNFKRILLLHRWYHDMAEWSEDQ
jgi:hypothetical protein